MIKVTREFETAEEAIAFLGEATPAPAKKKKKAVDDDELLGDAGEEEEPEEKPVTMKQIQALIESVAAADEELKPQIKALLKKHGATGGASTLPKTKHAAFYAALKKLEA